MKQSTLFSSFSVTNKVKTKTEASPVDEKQSSNKEQDEKTKENSMGTKKEGSDSKLKHVDVQTKSSPPAKKRGGSKSTKKSKLSLSEPQPETPKMDCALDTQVKQPEALSYLDFLKQVAGEPEDKPTKENDSAAKGVSFAASEAKNVDGAETKSKAVTSYKANGEYENKPAKKNGEAAKDVHEGAKKKKEMTSKAKENGSAVKDISSTEKEIKNIDDGAKKKKEETTSKAAMSYTDFLSLFKPAPVTPADDADPEESQTENVPSEGSKPQKEVKCKPISSFFLKTGAKKEEKKVPQQKSSMTVVAEVYPRRGTLKSKAAASPLKLEDRKKTESVADPDAIELLSSETIEVDDDTIQASKKRKNDSELDNEEKSKKQKKAIDDLQGIKADTAILTKKIDTKNNENVVSKSMNEVKIHSKKSQSQLCFGKSGLEVSKKKTEPVDVTLTEDAGIASNVSSKKTQAKSEKTTRSRRSQQQAVSEKGNSKEDSPERSEKSSANTDKDEQTEEDTSAETPTLRRSSRVRRPVQTVDEPEVVDIEDVDDDGDDDDEEGKRHRSKKSERRSTSNKEVSKENGSKKAKGPLAPIFTSVKAKEEIAKPPPEDPEKVRLRREFMMSGIPDELRRQIATASLAVVVADFPPFPNPSHVRQLVEEEAAFSCDKIAIPLKALAVGDEDLCDTSIGWKKFGLEPVSVSSASSYDLKFQGPSSLSKDQVNFFLKELQKLDVKFSFDKTFTQLSQPLQVKDVPEKAKIESKEAVTPTRRKRKAKKVDNDDDDILIVDETSPKKEETMETTSVIHPDACLWSDLHQPSSPGEMVGNSAVLTQLKDWLAEWKTIMQREVKKKSRSAAQQPSKSKGRGCWSDDDSDFTDSEDDEDDMRLCNTMLLTGPHGVGKTAAVYALAQELEYKVFEVNSSSLRSGKHILSQLEEATQSHRVAPSKRPNPPQLDTPPPGTFNSKQEGDSKKHPKTKPKSAASAFASLFQTAGQKSSKVENSTKSKKQEKIKEATKPGAKAKSETKPSSKKKPEKPTKSLEEESSANSKTGANSKNLATTSLILFDEADVVFEEDKGFLATVQYLMSSTKIPIVLTSTVSSHDLQLQARHDHVVFKRPFMASSVSFLCCICLAHGVPVSRRSVKSLLQALRGDLRRCLQQLQFWCQSGGGRRRGQLSAACDERVEEAEMVDVMDCDDAGKTGRFTKTPSFHEDNSNSNDFLSLTRRSRRAKRMILDDDDDEEDKQSVGEDSNSSLTFNKRLNERSSLVSSEVFPASYTAPAKRKRLSTKKSQAVTADLTSNSSPSIRSSQGDVNSDVVRQDCSGVNFDTCSDLHLDLLESMLGLERSVLESQTVLGLIQLPKLSSCNLDDAIQIVDLIDRCVNCSCLYKLALCSLPLPKCDRPEIKLQLPGTPPEQNNKKKRRRIVEEALFDSEQSDEETSVPQSGIVGGELEEEMQEAKAKHVESKSSETCHSATDSQTNGEEIGIKEISETCSNEDEGRKEEHILKGSDKGENKKKEEDISKDCDGNKQKRVFSNPRHNKACLSLLSDMARYYDSVSIADVFESVYSKQQEDVSKLSPSMSDDDVRPTSAESHCFASQVSWGVGRAVSLLASRSLYQRVGETMVSWQEYTPGEAESVAETDGEDAWPEELHLPVGHSVPDIWDLTDKDQTKRPNDSTTRNVINCVGSSALLVSDPTIHVDYLPALREICRSENAREQAKIQRRFHHYLDNCGLALKKSTIACLTSTYSQT